MSLRDVERILSKQKSLRGDDVQPLVRAIQDAIDKARDDAVKQSAMQVAKYAATFGGRGSGDASRPNAEVQNQVQQFLSGNSVAVPSVQQIRKEGL